MRRALPLSLLRLLSLHPTIPVTVFLRSTVLDSALLTTPKLTIKHGNFADFHTLTPLAASHSIVINAASSADTDLTTALLAGARKRKEQTGRNLMLLHLSEAGNFAVGPYDGVYNTQAEALNDTDPQAVRRIDATYLPNGPCDELVFNAAAVGDVNAYLICPGGMYGANQDHIATRSDDPVAESFANAPGVWVKWMVENVQSLGFSPYVREGSSVFSVVHVDDVLDLIVLVTKLALKNEEYKKEDVYNHSCLCVNEELRNKDIAGAFAEMLGVESRSVGFDGARTVKKGVRNRCEVFVADFDRYLGGNMLLRAGNAKTLGWSAKRPGLVEVLRGIVRA